MPNQDITYIPAAQLSPGMLIVLANGVLNIDGDVEESSSIPGLMVVETEVGCLYLDPETEVGILNS